MGVLRNLEAKLENLVEGLFSRTFKSRVQPVELARKLGKEMEEHKTVSISRTYVPNEYTVFLSSEDYSEVQGYARALSQELAAYLVEHARREELTLLTKPVIEFTDDERLRLGEFGIQTRLVKPPTEDEDGGSQGDLGQTMVYSALDAPEAPKTSRSQEPVLLIDGKRFPIRDQSTVVGRSSECQIVVPDTNISRSHARISQDDEHWYVADLDSMNGVVLNGRRVDSSRLAPGDELVLGTTKIVFELE